MCHPEMCSWRLATFGKPTLAYPQGLHSVAAPQAVVCWQWHGSGRCACILLTYPLTILSIWANIPTWLSWWKAEVSILDVLHIDIHLLDVFFLLQIRSIPIPFYMNSFWKLLLPSKGRAVKMTKANEFHFCSLLAFITVGRKNIVFFRC